MNCRLLQAIDETKYEDYLQNGDIQEFTYNQNEIIFFEGDQCEKLLILKKGEIYVERIDEDGKILTVATFQENDTLGANLLFSSHPFFPLTVTSKTQTDAILIYKSVVTELCQSNHEFLSVFLEIISDHSVILGTKVKDHVSKSIRESIILLLNKEYSKQKSLTIKLPQTKKALATSMGIARTSLSRELNHMVNEQIIEVNRSIIKIIDTSILYHY